MKSRPDGSFIWTIILGLYVLMLVIIAQDFPRPLRFTPFLAGYGTLAMIGVLILGHYYPEILRWTETTLQDFWGGDRNKKEQYGATGSETTPAWSAVARSIAYIIGYLALVIVFGLVVITPIFITTYLITEAHVKPFQSVLASLSASLVLIFGMVLLQVEIWAGIVREIIPDYLGGSIFPPL